MVKAIYGLLSPASGEITAPVRGAYKAFTILVTRVNFEEHEEKGCPKCANNRDIIVLSIDSEEVFCDCPCGHRWIRGTNER